MKLLPDSFKFFPFLFQDGKIKRFGQAQVLTLQDAAQEIYKMKGLSVFQGTQDLVSYLENTERFVNPKELVLKSVNVLFLDSNVQKKDGEFAY